MKVKVEVCCGSAADVYEAANAGVERVELNSALFLGGLTPSIGEMRMARGAPVEIIAMVRPREGGFCYGDMEFETMLADARALLDAGADGIAFGILNADGTVDKKRCARMMEEIGGAQGVFHRAVDVTPDWRAALDVLLGLGARRVLTSGQAPSADHGAAVIRAMIDYAAGRLEILPGGGIRMRNLRDVLEKTGCDQVHVSMRKTCADISCAHRPEIHFGGALYPPEDVYGATDGAAVRELVGKLVNKP
ncbi:MAG: hypothetical protein FWG71_09785 [Synergistaceae bacterium]|nr:hypothetical protein [Synergistaceae bacterium]